MQIPSSANYKLCYKKACDFLEEFNLKAYPIEPFDIIKEIGFEIDTYSNLAKRDNVLVSDICKRFTTSEAITFYDGKECFIFYNDTLNKNFIRFTLMHEIGHIYLGHLAKYESLQIIPTQSDNSLSLSQYTILENEANAFARNVLSPVSTVNHLKDKSTENIMVFFGLTHDAAITRLSFYDRDIYYANSLKLSKRLDIIATRYFWNKKCRICGHGSYQKQNICIICGNKMERGDGDIMKYPMLNVNLEGKLVQCPICQNEETDIAGIYCQICGTSLVNSCTNCMMSLPSNARYCPSCGYESIFFKENILKAWNASENNAFIQIPNGIENVFEDDEFFPFN